MLTNWLIVIGPLSLAAQLISIGIIAWRSRRKLRTKAKELTVAERGPHVAKPQARV